MPHVFISYVREDGATVQRLADALNAGGVDVWLDRERLSPGVRWQAAIRQAIRDGSFFIACFSANYAAREQSYMNDELIVAIEELRKRSTDRAWFLPVLLNPGTLPSRSIGAGESLEDLQFVELHDAWDDGVKRLLLAINPSYLPPGLSSIERALADLRTRSEDEQEQWVMWAWDHGGPREQEIARAFKGYGEIIPRGGFQRTLEVSYGKIWRVLFDLEEYLRHGLVETLGSVQSTDELTPPIFAAHSAVRQEMGYLPAELCVPLESLFAQMTADYNVFLEVLRKIYATGTRRLDDPDTARAVNDALRTTVEHFSEGMNRFRDEYSR